MVRQRIPQHVTLETTSSLGQEATAVLRKVLPPAALACDFIDRIVGGPLPGAQGYEVIAFIRPYDRDHRRQTRFMIFDAIDQMTDRAVDVHVRPTDEWSEEAEAAYITLFAR